MENLDLKGLQRFTSPGCLNIWRCWSVL